MQKNKIRVLYLYMFPLWGNGSGAWLRRLTAHLHMYYKESFESAIIAPDHRELPHTKVYHLTPPEMGVFVGNPELKESRKYSQFSNLELIELVNYYLYQSAKIVEKYKPDVIHAFHTAFLPHIARTLANFYKIPFIFTTHGSDLYYFKEDTRWKSLMLSASQKATFITANSHFTKDWYLKLFGGQFRKKLMVIPSGIQDNVDFSKDVSWIDKKYNFRHKHMVLFTGRLTEHKGVEYLITAAQKIQAEIVIVGDGPEKPYLEKLVKKYKLNNVHIVGYLSQRNTKIKDFYLRADVYVAPSVWKEPLGLVLLEAMVHKTPVIVTQSGGVKTIVENDVTGYLVYAKRADMIAKKVNYLLANDSKRRKMGENAYKRVLEKFNWDKISAQFYNMYERTINK